MENGHQHHQPFKSLFWRNFLLILILIIVIGISWWLGAILGRYSLRDLMTKPLPPTSMEREMEGKEGKEAQAPFFVYIGGEPCNEVVQKEFQYAKDTGIMNYIIDVPFPWRGSDDLPEFFRILQCMYDINPRGKYWLFLDLNPPEDWFSGKKSAQMVIKGEIQPYACFNAPSWRKAIEESLGLMIHSLQSSNIGGQIGGFILGFLKNRWWIAPGLDESEYALSSFNTYLQNYYPNAEERKQLFGAETLDSSIIIEALHKEVDASSIFLQPEQHRILINYRRFFNESLADTIGFCAMTLRQLLSSDKKVKIYVPYGMNLETADSLTGQFSLENLLESDVDGFIFPVSYINRGLGETGGPAGTLESVSLHGKDILIFDDTRTGISIDPATQQIVRVKGVRAENIHSVQKRNMGLALVHHAGLIWTDPEGKGWLLDTEQWDLFKKMMQVYERVMTQEKEPRKLKLQPKPVRGLNPDNLAVEGTSLPRLQVGKYNTEELSSDYTAIVPQENILWEPLAMIIDERAIPLLSDKGATFFSSLINTVRDQLLKVGLPIEFYLMQDLLDEHIPKKMIYLIFNLYPPTENEIQTLHHIFESDKAIVIWYYLPIWGNPTNSLELIQQVTQINVKWAETGTQTGSRLELEGRWLNKGETWGEPMNISPLLYVDDADADVIARYQSNGKPSIAVKTINEKWVSVLYAEPAISNLAIREILSILEVPTVIAEGSAETQDTILVGANTLVLHTKGIGDRILQFNQFLNIENLFQPEQKWFERETLLLSLGSGETLFLYFQPQ